MTVQDLSLEPAWSCHALIENATGEVVEVGRSLTTPGDEPVVMPVPEGHTRIALTANQYAVLRGGTPCRMVNGQLETFVRVVELGALKAHAIEQIDRHAENARLKFISPGSGQALEYQMTEFEARQFLAQTTEDLTDYPFLEAEVDAIQQATGVRPGPVEVAQSVVTQASAWHAAGATIKRLRRIAKLAVQNATTKQDIDAALNIAWPEPGLA